MNEVEQELRWHEDNGPVIDDDRYMPVSVARALIRATKEMAVDALVAAGHLVIEEPK